MKIRSFLALISIGFVLDKHGIRSISSKCENHDVKCKVRKLFYNWQDILERRRIYQLG